MSVFLKKYFIFLPLCLFIFFSIVRLNNLNHVGYFYDTVTTQYNWATDAYNQSVFSYWYEARKGIIDYPPIALVLITFLKSVSIVLLKIFHITNPILAFTIVLKLFNWAIDTLISFCVYKLALKNKNTQEKAILYSSIIYAAPSMWFVSIVWGQIDSFIILVLLYIIYKLLKAENGYKIIFLGILYTLIFFVKLQSFLFIPAIFLILIQREKIIKILQYSFILLISIIIGFLPFILEKINYNPSVLSFNGFYIVVYIFPILFVTYLILKKIRTKMDNFILGFLSSFIVIYFVFSYFNYDRLNYTLSQPFLRTDFVSFGAWNIWESFGFRGLANENFILNIPINLWSLLLFLLFFIGSFLLLFYIPKTGNISFKRNPSFITNSFKNISKYILKKELNFKIILSIIFIQTGAYYIFMTKMHSRYLHSAIIISFVLLTYKWREKGALLIGVFLMNAIYFLNQLAVYVKKPDFMEEFNYISPIMNMINNLVLKAGDSQMGIFLIIGFVCVVYAIFQEFKYIYKSSKI